MMNCSAAQGLEPTQTLKNERIFLVISGPPSLGAILTYLPSREKTPSCPLVSETECPSSEYQTVPFHLPLAASFSKISSVKSSVAPPEATAVYSSTTSVEVAAASEAEISPDSAFCEIQLVCIAFISFLAAIMGLTTAIAHILVFLPSLKKKKQA